MCLDGADEGWLTGRMGRPVASDGNIACLHFGQAHGPGGFPRPDVSLNSGANHDSVVNVFGAQAKSDDAAKEAFDRCYAADEPDGSQRWVRSGEPYELAGLASLQRLCPPKRGLASSLDVAEVGGGERAGA